MLASWHAPFVSLRAESGRFRVGTRVALRFLAGLDQRAERIDNEFGVSQAVVRAVMTLGLMPA
jgi:hypothetical protein